MTICSPRRRNQPSTRRWAVLAAIKPPLNPSGNTYDGPLVVSEVGCGAGCQAAAAEVTSDAFPARKTASSPRSEPSSSSDCSKRRVLGRDVGAPKLEASWQLFSHSSRDAFETARRGLNEPPKRPRTTSPEGKLKNVIPPNHADGGGLRTMGGAGGAGREPHSELCYPIWTPKQPATTGHNKIR